MLSSGRGQGLELLCELSKAPYEPAALNALWAIKNFLFRSSEKDREVVMAYLGWDHLKRLVLNQLTTCADELQATLAGDGCLTPESRLADLTKPLGRPANGRYFEDGRSPGGKRSPRSLAMLGQRNRSESASLGKGHSCTAFPQRAELLQVLYVVANLAVGNEKLRMALVGRVEIVEALSEALVGEYEARSDARRLTTCRTRTPMRSKRLPFLPYST